MQLNEFCERLKSDGAYIGNDNHVHRKDGRLLSRQSRNGYWVVRKMYDARQYELMEHRVIYCMVHGAFDERLVINHIDFDRSNNAIANLELVTQRENVQYTMKHNRARFLKGCDNPRAMLSEKDVQLIRYLCKNGYSQKKVAEIYDVAHANLISRVVNGARYGEVQDAASVLAVYPLLVKKTCRNDLPKEERIKNALFGLNGEAGEVIDLFKKHFYQGHELDINHVIEELGDVLYYVCWLLNELDSDLAEVAFENMVKLNARYPDGFDANRSIHRPEYERRQS